MKLFNKIKSLHPNNKRSGTPRPLLVTAISILILFLLFLLPATHHIAASELPPQEAATKAKQLQLEGTQLQLKGNLEEAVRKYKESISYKPNSGLERLVGSLEKMIAKKEQAAAASSPLEKQPFEPAQQHEQAAAPEPAPAVQEEPGQPEVAPVLPETGKQPLRIVKAVLPQRTPASPEEELIYGFTDWFISLFPAKTDQTPFGLKTEYNYAITAINGNYEVNLEEFVFFLDENESFNLSPLVFNFQPQGADKLTFQINLPEKSSFETGGQATAELTIADRSITGEWDRTMQYCDSSEMKLGNILFKPLEGNMQVEVKQLRLSSLYTKQNNQVWDEQFNGTLQGITVVDGDESVAIGDIALEYSLDGSNSARYEEIRKSFPGIAFNFEQVDLSGSKEIFQHLDEYFQLLNSYDFQVSMQNFAVETKEDSTKWDSFSFSGNLKKNPSANIFTGKSEARVKGIAFTGKPTQEGMPVMSFALDEVLYNGNTDMKVPPPTLFTDFFAAIEAAEKAAAEQTAGEKAAGMQSEAEKAVEDELARQSLGFTKAILGLFKTSSVELGISGFAVENAMPGPVKLNSAKIGGGFATGTGEGGKIHGLLTFSGLAMGETENQTMPQAATVNFALDKIPSFLDLISDPSAIAEGDLKKAQGEVMLNAMNTFMMSPITLTLNDSFISFANSRFNLDLALTLDSASKFMSTGTVNIAIENPEDLMQVAQALGADPEMQRMLTTLTAVSNRTEEKGRIVDRVDARLDQEGKVFVNAKDVTLLFFPEQPETPEPAAEASPTEEPPLEEPAMEEPPMEGPPMEEQSFPEPGANDEQPTGT